VGVVPVCAGGDERDLGGGVIDTNKIELFRNLLVMERPLLIMDWIISN